MKSLIRAIIPPLITRVGTVLATVLLAQGFPPELTDQFISVMGAMSLVAMDILLSKTVKGA